MDAPTVAKKKTNKEPSEGFFLLRLPIEYRDLLHEIQEHTRRPMTTEAQIALERRAKHFGIEFDYNYPDSI
jgi:hypothetical protein